MESNKYVSNFFVDFFLLVSLKGNYIAGKLSPAQIKSRSLVRIKEK